MSANVPANTLAPVPVYVQQDGWASWLAQIARAVNFLLTGPAPAISQSTPANPTGTANTTGVMMGLAGSITPAASGVVTIIISGVTFNSVNGWNNQLQIRYGTGTAPANGAALTGTAVGALQGFASGASSTQMGYSLNAVVSGLTPGVAYWLDVSLASSFGGGTASIAANSISAFEVAA